MSLQLCFQLRQIPRIKGIGHDRNVADARLPEELIPKDIVIDIKIAGDVKIDIVKNDIDYRLKNKLHE